VCTGHGGAGCGQVGVSSVPLCGFRFDVLAAGPWRIVMNMNKATANQVGLISARSHRCAVDRGTVGS